MTYATPLLSVFFLLGGCSSESGDTEPAEETVDYLEPPAEGEGFQFVFDAVAPAYTEVWLCMVYTIPIEEASAVNWVDFDQTPGVHHMTLSSPGLTPIGMEKGLFECEDIYADLMDEAIMFFGSGDNNGTMHLPDGIAATFPVGIEVVHEMHYVNTTDQDVDLFSRVNAYTIPISEVEAGIWGGQVRDEFIEIPAKSSHTEWTRCVMNEAVDVLFLASHTHELGVEFTIAPFDGVETGEVFYTNTDWHDPLIVQYEEPIVLEAGEGFEFTCTWDNESSEAVNYGSTSNDEMCNLAIVHTPMSTGAQCEVVESSDGVLWSP